VQSAGDRTTHVDPPAVVDTGRQHAPRAGGGQVVALQTELSPLYAPMRAVQFAAVTTTHPLTVPDAAGRQHAPRTTHVSLPHVLLAPRQLPCVLAQLASVVIVQARTPSGFVTQQAPVTIGGQSVAEHTLLAPFHEPPASTQLASVRITHTTFAPMRGLQHAPVISGAGQVVFVQTVPAPFHTVPPEA
jgi:hypothetical protein